MNKDRKTILVALMAVTLCAALTLPGCSLLGRMKSTPAAAPVSAAAEATIVETSAEAEAAATSPAPAGGAAGSPDEFAAAFQTVDRNPLNEAIQFALWYAAQHPEEAGPSATAAASSNLMQRYADQYAALVAEKGIHYIEVSNAMGMEIKTEVWVKGQKFKKVIPDLGQVTVNDGTSYIQYDESQKTGTKSAADTVAAETALMTKGMLAQMAASPGQQKDDEKIGKFDCSVFFYDIEIMGFKGETLYVDKATGMLVKTQIGDPKDKNSMSTVVESLDIGGFGDDVFTVPDGMKLVDG